jgi:hypothetical protein
VRSRDGNRSREYCGCNVARMLTNKTHPALAGLTALERKKRISPKAAAELNDVSEATFRRHYSHLIEKVSARRDGVRVEDALTLPPPDDG